MKKGRLNNITLFSGILLSLFPLSLIRMEPDESEEVTAESGMTLQTEPSVAVRLDVPLLNQLDSPALLLGCEVTALAMILQYNEMPVIRKASGKTTPMPFFALLYYFF